MRSIDVHDLPEPVAQAIAEMVATIRAAGGPRAFLTRPGNGRTVGEILKPILDEAANLRLEAGPPLKGEEAEVAQGIADNFRRQGLKL
jgi:hypothetical protein